MKDYVTRFAQVETVQRNTPIIHSSQSVGNTCAETSKENISAKVYPDDHE